MKTVYDRMVENNSYQKTKDFIIKQKWPYSSKKAYAEKIAWEFYQHPDIAGRCYVTVGGLDSITLFLFLRSIGINVPAVSVSSLEDKSIQIVHKALGIRSLPPHQGRKREALHENASDTAIRLSCHIQRGGTENQPSTKPDQ